MGQRKSKIEQKVAQDILCALKEKYRILRANSGQDLFYQMCDYITQTYLAEDDGDDNT